MNHFEQLLKFILEIQVWEVAKLISCLTLLLYLVFASIVIRQVQLMSKTLMVPIDLPIKLLAWFHLLLAIFVFLLALMIL